MTSVIDEIERRKMGIALKLRIPTTLMLVSYIDKLLGRAAINEWFLEDQELDARFKNWAKEIEKKDRKERGLPEGGGKIQWNQ